MSATPPDAPQRRRNRGSYVALFVKGGATQLGPRRRIALDARRRARQRDLLAAFQAAVPDRAAPRAPGPHSAPTLVEVTQTPACLPAALDPAAVALAACVGPMPRAAALAMARDLAAHDDTAETRLVLCCELARVAGVRVYADLTAVYPVGGSCPPHPPALLCKSE